MTTRDRILAAALAHVEATGFAGLSVAAVAADAGVSRQTVYAQFDSLSGVLAEAVGVVILEVVTGLHAGLAHLVDPAEHLEELIVAARAATRGHPVLSWLVRSQADNPVLSAGMMDRALVITRGLLQPLADRDPVVAAALDDLLEPVIRWGMSVILFESPATATDDGLRAFLRRWARPALNEILAGAAQRALRSS